MSKVRKTGHVTPPDGNVFLDLGFDPDLAAALQVESQRIIAEKMAVKEEAKVEETNGRSAQKP